MNTQETAKILALIKRSYPNSFNNLDEKGMAETVMVWSDLFKDYPFDIVQRALKEFILKNNSPWAPSPGQLNNIIAERIKEPEDKLNCFEAWDLVVGAMSNSAYNSVDEFNKLPQTIQKCVGSAGILRDWAITDYNDLKFIKNNFYQRFKEVQEENEDRLAMPEMVLQRLGNLRLLEEKNDI